MQALLEAALSCFDEAAIYTIHGFCQRALGDTPLAAGLPYGLELMEDDAELRHEAVADFWRRKVSGKQGDPDLAAWLAVRFDSPISWAALLKRLQAKPLSRQIWPDDLDEPVQPLRGPLKRRLRGCRDGLGAAPRGCNRNAQEIRARRNAEPRLVPAGLDRRGRAHLGRMVRDR
jgi:hypothetical protein